MVACTICLWLMWKNRSCVSALPLGWIVRHHPQTSTLKLPYPGYDVQYIHPLNSCVDRHRGHLVSVCSTFPEVSNSNGLPGIGLPLSLVRMSTSLQSSHQEIFSQIQFSALAVVCMNGRNDKRFQKGFERLKTPNRHHRDLLDFLEAARALDIVPPQRSSISSDVLESICL